jgi:hypothetical protein
MIGRYTSLFSDMNMRDVILPRNIGGRTVVLAKFNDVRTQQHNGAELLALVIALRLASIIKTVKYIKCDSSTIICWTKGGPRPNTRKNMDKNKLRYIEEGIRLRLEFENRGGIVEKISGDDNLADLGYHK